MSLWFHRYACGYIWSGVYIELVYLYGIIVNQLLGDKFITPVYLQVIKLSLCFWPHDEITLLLTLI